MSWPHQGYPIFPLVYLTTLHIHYWRYVWRPYTVRTIRMASIYIKDGMYGVQIYYRRYVWCPYTLQTVRMASIFSTNGTYGVQSAIHWEHLDLHSSFLPDAANCSQRQMLNHYRTFLVYSNKCSTCPFTHSSSVVIIWTLSLTFDNPTCCPHTRIYVFCVVLRTKGDYFPIQHWLIGSYKLGGECLLRGTSWTPTYNSGYCQSAWPLCTR